MYVSNFLLTGAGANWQILDGNGNVITIVAGSESLITRPGGPVIRGVDYTIAGSVITFIQNIPQAGDSVYASFEQIVPAVTASAYSSQTDMENLLGIQQLAQLTNDTAGAVTPDPAVVAALINRADRLIDAKAGQVYAVPFDATPVTGNCTAVPSLINQISAIYACYYAMARRFGISGISKDWQTMKSEADQQLDDISNELAELDGNPTVASTESDIITPTSDALTNFYNQNTPLNGFIDDSMGNV